MDRLSDLLDQLPCFLVHNRLMRVLKNEPFILGLYDSPFVFVGLFVRAEIDSMPHVLRL